MQKNANLKTWVRLALLVAVQLAMRALGLGKVPVGPLNMSFLTLPIAVGALCMGPAAGLVLGGVFGGFSLFDAVSGTGGMTSVFFSLSPVHTVILCLGMRMAMGVGCAWVFRLCRRLDGRGIWSYFVGAISAPLLNTLFFMGYLCLAFYGTDFVQEKAAALGAANPFAFVILLVGVQGLVEALVCGALGGIVSRAVHRFFLARSEA